MMKANEYTEVLADLYSVPDTKVWIAITTDLDSIEIMQGTDRVILPRDAFERFYDEVKIIDEDAEAQEPDDACPECQFVQVPNHAVGCSHYAEID